MSEDKLQGDSHCSILTFLLLWLVSGVTHQEKSNKLYHFQPHREKEDKDTSQRSLTLQNFQQNLSVNIHVKVAHQTKVLVLLLVQVIELQNISDLLIVFFFGINIFPSVSSIHLHFCITIHNF